MTKREVKQMVAGCEFISHRPNRDRRSYRVIAVDAAAIEVVDQYGYATIVRFDDPSNKPFFANAHAAVSR